jgi:hypothetical protein
VQHVQHSTVEHGTVEHSTVQHNTVQHGMSRLVSKMHVQSELQIGNCSVDKVHSGYSKAARKSPQKSIISHAEENKKPENLALTFAEKSRRWKMGVDIGG